MVTEADMAIWESDEGCQGCCVADVNWDGIVNEADETIIDNEIATACEGYRPIPLFVWDSSCYDSPCDPNCQDGKGCLPIDRDSGSTAGIHDVNGDGWPDAVTRSTIGGTTLRRVYINSGVQLTAPLSLSWIEECLDPNLVISTGYGQHLGDFTDDGYPDVSTARPDTDLLVNPGDPNDPNCFILVNTCLGVPAQTNIETIIWGDVDGDIDVDLFLPAYEDDTSDPNATAGGNRLLLNLGSNVQDPNDPDSCPPAVWTLDTDPNLARDAGLQAYGPSLPADYRDPEGCVLADHDRDGDGDLFYSQRVWQNVTTTADAPEFVRLDTDVTGVTMYGIKEEGTVACDLDLDGDLDLVHVPDSGNPSADGFLSRGDGEFFSALSLSSDDGYGVSAVDWDNDGDVDVTVGGAFWQNRFIETAGAYSGTSTCWVQIFNREDLTYGVISHALPAWLDADRDGDLDCARGAWGPGASKIRFERNRLYHGGPCASCEPVKRYVNIRPVRAALDDNGPNDVRDYTENEFGALAELVLRNGDPNTAHFRRIHFTCTGSGYLQQNEYLLHFGLPADPEPTDPNDDLRFDVYVDFLARGDEPNEGSGIWRVDWTVNSELADIDLADLYVACTNPDPATIGRPITVYRDGRVHYKGGDPNQAPADPNIARLYTLGGRLTLPGQGSPLPDPISGNTFAGVRFIKGANSPELRIREFIVDGQLDQTTSGCAYNLVVLDMTDPNDPTEVGGLKAYTFPDNRRTFVHVPPQSDPDAFIIPANGSGITRTYEVRARLTSYRMNTLPDLNGLSGSLGIKVDKGLRTASSPGKDLCSEAMLLNTTATTPVTIRLSPTGN